MCHLQVFVSSRRYTRGHKYEPGAIIEATTEKNIRFYLRDEISGRVENSTKVQ